MLLRERRSVSLCISPFTRLCDSADHPHARSPALDSGPSSASLHSSQSGCSRVLIVPPGTYISLTRTVSLYDYDLSVSHRVSAHVSPFSSWPLWLGREIWGASPLFSSKAEIPAAVGVRKRPPSLSHVNLRTDLGISIRNSYRSDRP